MFSSSLKMLLGLRGTLLKFYSSKLSAVPGVNLRNYWHSNSFSGFSSAMQSMEKHMREMDRFFYDFHRSSPSKISHLFAPFQFIRTKNIPVVSTDGNAQNYRLELNMHGMKPENIKITLIDHELKITARLDEKQPDGSRFVRENSYHYSLPKEINQDSVRSSLSEGMLTIEASLSTLESKEIPVKIESLGKSDSKKS